MTRLWEQVTLEIPEEKIGICVWIALTRGPRKNYFGPWDLVEAWRENLRGPDGRPVRGVAP